MTDVRINWDGDTIKRLAGSESGPLAQAMTLALNQLHRYASGIVHVDTGRLKNSLFVAPPVQQQNALVGAVATNVEYAIYEHNRGGDHAFFQRTIEEEGPAVNDLFSASLGGGLSDTA